MLKGSEVKEGSTFIVQSLFSSVDRAPEQCSVPGRSIVKRLIVFLGSVHVTLRNNVRHFPRQIRTMRGGAGCLEPCIRWWVTLGPNSSTLIGNEAVRTYFSTSSTFLAVCCKHVTYKPLQSHDGLVQHVLRPRKCLNSRFMEAVTKPRWNVLSLSGLG